MTYAATMIVERSITPYELPSSRSAGDAPTAGSAARDMVRLSEPRDEQRGTYSREERLIVMNLISIS